jgi:hypothetical protein
MVMTMLSELTCAYVFFFIVCMCYRNQSASFDSCERDSHVGKVAKLSPNNRMAINGEVVLLIEEW